MDFPDWVAPVLVSLNVALLILVGWILLGRWPRGIRPCRPLWAHAVINMARRIEREKPDLNALGQIGKDIQAVFKMVVFVEDYDEKSTTEITPKTAEEYEEQDCFDCKHYQCDGCDWKGWPFLICNRYEKQEE